MRQSPQYLKQMLSPKDLQEESNIIAYSIYSLVKKKRGAQSLNVLCYIRIVVPFFGFTRNSAISTFDTITIVLTVAVAGKNDK